MSAKYRGKITASLLGRHFLHLIDGPSSTCQPDGPTYRRPSENTTFTNPCKFFSAEMLNLIFQILRGETFPQ